MDYLTSESLGSTIFTTPSTEVTDTYHHACSFMCVLGIQSQVLVLAWQVLYLLSHLPDTKKDRFELK